MAPSAGPQRCAVCGRERQATRPALSARRALQPAGQAARGCGLLSPWLVGPGTHSEGPQWGGAGPGPVAEGRGGHWAVGAGGGGREAQGVALTWASGGGHWAVEGRERWGFEGLRPFTSTTDTVPPWGPLAVCYPAPPTAGHVLPRPLCPLDDPQALPASPSAPATGPQGPASRQPLLPAPRRLSGAGAELWPRPRSTPTPEHRLQQPATELVPHATRTGPRTSSSCFPCVPSSRNGLCVC